MSSEPPPGSGEQPPEDDPFRKRPPSEQGPGSPYDTPTGGTEPPPTGGTEPPPPGGTEPPRYGGGPYGGGGPPGGSPYGDSPYGGGPGAPYPGGPYGAGGPQGGGYPGDPLAGMPPLADTGRRIVARLIDLILVGIVAFLVLVPLWLSVSESDTDLVVTGKGFVVTVVSTVLYVAYDTLTTAKWGRTLGKKLLSLRVANLTDGSTPTARTSFVRALVLWGPSVVPCCFFSLWWIVSSAWSFFDKPYKQGIHDKAARTVVVSTG
ncbi:RDD family protein [Streptomyces actinomycinicus]|uniref:RDD family protein n=1 Tax=Streptomyces actinomycinicus TaxID=1695166 RepID=A0A937ECL7_9ACTN|nr:RDD family protein [Streptomyces actinomycinicus]MBL1080392.1 RDD family protein [Streptomyces actinomycinicus]